MLPDYNEKYYDGIIEELKRLNNRLTVLKDEQVLMNKKLDTIVRHIQQNGYKINM